MISEEGTHAATQHKRFFSLEAILLGTPCTLWQQEHKKGKKKLAAGGFTE